MATLSELAQAAGSAVIVGDAGLNVTGIRPVDTASSTEITFLTSDKYLGAATASKAAAIIVDSRYRDTQFGGIAKLIVDDPKLAYARIARFFAEASLFTPSISPLASIAADAVIDPEVIILPFAVIGSGATIAKHTVVHPHAVIGERCTIGEGTTIHPHVTLYPGTVIGSFCAIHAGAVIGSDGFGFAFNGESFEKIPQLGIAVIGDHVEIGANVTIDRATFEQTRIGNGVKTDNQVHIGHNVTVGDHTLIVAQVGISGSAHIGSYCMVGGQAGFANHVTVGDGVMIGGKSGVTKDVPSGKVVSGYPLTDHKNDLKIQAVILRLPELRERIVKLERIVKKLTESHP